MNLLSSLFLPKTIDPSLPTRLTHAQKTSWNSFFKKNSNSLHSLQSLPLTKHSKSFDPSSPKSHEITTLVTIDSADRDVYNFPHSSSFTIFPGKMFSRITQVQVVSTAIPNLDTVITQYNNTLMWINQEDFDIGYPTYQITLSTGNYTLANLVARLETQLNDSKIRRRGGQGPPHVFDISLNKDTGELVFNSFIARPLGITPFQTTQGSSIIQVVLINHGYDVGDSVRIIFLNDNIGGISPQYFNSDLVVQSVIDSNTFTVDVGVQAASSGTYGSLGIYLGISAPFQFLLDSSSGESFMAKLGFTNENSSDASTIKTISTLVSDVTNIDFNVWPCKITLSTSIPFQSGDRFNFVNFDWGSNDLNNKAQTGFSVLSVIDNYSFFTTFGLSSSDGLNSLCSWTPQITKVSFNKLVVETTIPEKTATHLRMLTRIDPGRQISEIAFRCAVPHGLSKNDVVRISDTDSIPSADGVYIVSEVYTPIDFTVDAFLHEIDVDATLAINDGPLGNMYGKNSFLEGSLNHRTFVFKDKFESGPTEMTKPGKLGWINLETSFKLYGVPNFAGLNTGTLNGISFDIKSVSVSPSGFYSFVFEIPHQYPKESISLDGSSVRISSNSFGMNIDQKNYSSGLFNKGLFLHGEPYFFLCCPSLTVPHNVQSTMSESLSNKHTSVSTLTSYNVQNVLAILLLDNDQGKMVYDSFVATPRQFNPPLRHLDELKIELRTPRNQLADLQSLDWSFTLKIVEQIERT